MMTMKFQTSGKRKSPIRMVAIGGLSLAAIALSACSVLGSRHPVGNPSVPPPAKRVEVDRYLGRWFEIARYEQSFQKGCEAVTADYSLRPDGSIEVVNRCREPDGTFREARGRAKVVSQSGAKLKVSFFGPFYGDYWVLDRAEDYGWSIVGEPSGRYLWILTRNASPAAQEVDNLVGRARSLGYDTSMLIYTRQP
jgi:apolipoprotein D and lipocalin family protein